MSMQKIEFTEGALRAIVGPKSGRDYYRDARDAKLALAVTPAGTKTFFTTVTVRGDFTNRRITLGRWPDMKVASARRELSRVRGGAVVGENEIEKKRTQRKRAELTVAAALEEYLAERLVKNGSLPMKETSKADYRKKLKAALGDHYKKSVSAITERLVASKNTRSTANANGMRVGHALFRWLASRYPEIVERNPFAKLRVEKALYQPPPKTTFIKDDRIGEFLDCLDEKLTKESARVLVLFLLFCGTRITETMELLWSNVNLQKATFYVPDPKNRQPSARPLPVLIADKLRALKGDAADTDRVFSDLDPYAVFAALDFMANDNKRDDAPVIEARINPHDLRRTFITIGDSIDLPPNLIKRLANHAQAADVTESYKQYTIERFRSASQRIEREILRLAKRPGLAVVAAAA